MALCSSALRAAKPFVPARTARAPLLSASRQLAVVTPARQPESVTSSQSQDATTPAMQDNLWLKAAVAAGDAAIQPSLVASMVLLGLALSADPAVAADPVSSLQTLGDGHTMPVFDVAEQPFWSNIGRYARYFVTVMLGTGYVMLRPFQGLLKNPVTAVLGVGGLIAFIFLIKYTVELMTGVEVYDYDPDNFRIVTAY